MAAVQEAIITLFIKYIPKGFLIHIAIYASKVSFRGTQVGGIRNASGFVFKEVKIIQTKGKKTKIELTARKK